MSKLIRYSTFPRTEPPEGFVVEVVRIFESHIDEISTIRLDKGLTSDEILEKLRENLIQIGFLVEMGKRRSDKIFRPVLFGENGDSTLHYEIDGFHDEWKCGIEIEAGRAIMGNAVYRDLIQSLVMVNLDHLILAVPISYKYKSNKKQMISRDYEKTRSLLDTLYSHSRIRMPYKLTLIGY